MDPITLGLAALILGGIGFATKTEVETTPGEKLKGEIETEVLKRIKNATLISVPPLDKWQKLEYNGDSWLVAPTYIAPTGIGEAQAIAQANGAELPTPAMVDAIWKAADLKITPHPRGASSTPPSDFTAKTMNSPETHIAQLAYISKQIKESNNPDFKLLAGSHKDVVIGKTPNGDMHIGIYGWHNLNGKPIQDFMWGHAADWKDYSQGLRLIKKIPRDIA